MWVIVGIGEQKIPSRVLQLLFPFFIGTRFPPFYRVIDPIAWGKYAVSKMLMGQFQSAFTASLSSLIARVVSQVIQIACTLHISISNSARISLIPYLPTICDAKNTYQVDDA